MNLNVNGVELYYEQSGSGAPLILLHGNGENHEIFDKAIPILAKHFTVYALDSRGHGRSGGVAEYHYDDMCMDVVCFIRALQLEKPILYGFSDGGIVGLLLASKYPDLLKALLVSGANTRPEGMRKGWLRFFAWLNHRVHSSRMNMMLTEPDITAQDLAQILVPTLVLAGSHDLISPKDTAFIAEHIPYAEERILRGQGHGSYIVHKERIAQLILEFCGKLPK